MNELFKQFLSLTFSGSLLILAFLVCRPLLKDRLSRQWQYYIWLLVIARLLIPAAPQTNLVNSLCQSMNSAIEMPEAPGILQQSKTDASPAGSLENDYENGKQNQTGKSGATAKEAWNLVKGSLWLVWLAGAFILFVRKATTYENFVKYVKAGQTPVSDTGLLDRLAAIGEAEGIKKPVELCVNPLISSPLLLGFFHPCIVLPDINITEQDFRYIVLHELTHCRRQDMFYKWLVQAAVCLHWYNPFVYLMEREIDKACEFSCDEAMIAKMNPDNKRNYGKTLLNAMAAAGGLKDSIASLTFSDNKTIMKERLGAIMKFKKSSKITVCATVLLSFILCFLAAYTGVYAGENRLTPGSGTEDSQQIIKSSSAKKNGNLQTVVYESAKILHYTGEGAHPYIHDVKTNNTDKKIISFKRGMLAFDKNGEPLKIKWNGLEENPKRMYYYLCDIPDTIGAGKTDDVRGGWSLNTFKKEPAVERIAYILYCDKEITFADGTVWKNPDYAQWKKTYKGKKTDVKVLKNYYPYTHIISE